MKKIFVLDTNVILHDSHSIFHFEDNDVVIPITVIEEVDYFKKGQEQVNYHAREFIRQLDSFPGEKLVNDGVPLGVGLGKISIMTNYNDVPEVTAAFVGQKPDHRILSAAMTLEKQYPASQVILVSKDVNMRLKAKSLGLNSQDYYTDKIQDIEKLYTGVRVVQDFDSQLIDLLCQAPYKIKTIITRAGEGTKVVFTGDPHQIDTPYLDIRSTGLNYLIQRMKDQPLYAHITLVKGERSELAEMASNLL